jgi:SRSO17 transposase
MTIARAATPTVAFIDEYCTCYQDLFPDVRSYEHFVELHLGLLADLKRKSLPAIAKAVDGDAQALHHFLAYAPWSVDALRTRRLDLLKTALRGRVFVLCIDETGDRKKGHTTDYVASQYIGNLGKTENGIVAVTAYGVLDQITFPLLFQVFKPRSRLHPEETYYTKPQLAIQLIEALQATGFQFSVVLADSLYGESSEFVTALTQWHLQYVLALRSNHGAWLPKGAHLQWTAWQRFMRQFTDGTEHPRYIRERIYGQRHAVRYYQITTDPKTLPKESTWFIMTNLAGAIERAVGNTYGLRTWIEYGLKQSKNELGWADYRVTDYPTIERWWELVMSAYLLVSLHSPVLQPQEAATMPLPPKSPAARFPAHRWWDQGQGWKHELNNLRLILQPFILHCLILPWLLVFDIPPLRRGFQQLITVMNSFHAHLPF